MHKIDQTILHRPEEGQHGNCLSAVLASLLHLPIDSIPVFMSDKWQKELNEWLRPHGLAYLCLDNKEEAFALHCEEQGITDLYHEIAGPSPRHDDVQHAIVGFNFAHAHDPHPDRSGVTKNSSIGVFIALNPWEQVAYRDFCSRVRAIQSDADSLPQTSFALSISAKHIEDQRPIGQVRAAIEARNTTPLSERVRPGSEAAPWVIAEIKALEAKLAESQAEVSRSLTFEEHERERDQAVESASRYYEEKLAAKNAAAGQITNEMAYAFNRALGDSPLSEDETAEIKKGLEAALAHFLPGSAPAINTALLRLATVQRDWIDAVPQDTPLPAMPGFDRDWADDVLSTATTLQSGRIRTLPEVVAQFAQEIAHASEADQALARQIFFSMLWPNYRPITEADVRASIVGHLHPALPGESWYLCFLSNQEIADTTAQIMRRATVPDSELSQAAKDLLSGRTTETA